MMEAEVPRRSFDHEKTYTAHTVTMKIPKAIEVQNGAGPGQLFKEYIPGMSVILPKPGILEYSVPIVRYGWSAIGVRAKTEIEFVP